MIRLFKLQQEVKKEGLNVATPKIGEIVDYSQIESYQEHWWENVE